MLRAQRFASRVRNRLPALADVGSPLELPGVAPAAYHTGAHNKPKRVVVLGSGGLSIGQAGEFDYSGSQCIKAMKEENIETILINPNIATVQTSKGLADRVYFLPVTADFVTPIIEKEKPDGILLAFGGQTGLNCGVELHRRGVLDKHNIRVLGTSVEVIIATEDRDEFAKKCKEINQPIATSQAVDTIEDAVTVAKRIGYPVMIRSAFALGGLGSGICADETELREMASKALSSAPQILVERSMKGWKEVEYEVVRDCQDNCITVCNMENFDPMGIHTGDSIVVAPSQTLSNSEYHLLRMAAIKVIRHLGIVGECNIQYSLNPDSEEYSIIEVNARLSRSSALASKATGYPLAFVAAKLGLGIPLTHIQNAVTKQTTACFEPSLDYIVTKIPRWDLDKFERVDNHIGSMMQSVGEVMAIGRTFEESFQKALRMVNTRNPGWESKENLGDLKDLIARPTPERPWALAKAFEEGHTVDEMHEWSKIDKWFLHKLEYLFLVKKEIAKHTASDLPRRLMQRAKQAGFSDRQIAKYMKSTEDKVRSLRKAMKITPFVKQVDTLAAEYPARTNYLFTTYNGVDHDVNFNKGDKAIIVLGSGNYRIGSSVEFDNCAVSTVRTLRALGQKTITINYNPETVSTDYDECDRLYFEELSLERVLDVNELEFPKGVIVSVGGQIPNMLALPLSQRGVNVLGTSPHSIDQCEDRQKFSDTLDRLNIDQPEWVTVTSYDAAKAFAKKVGYPLLVRPSYVLSGAAMSVTHNDEELRICLQEAADVSEDHPTVLSKFYEGWRELEIDAVADNGRIVRYAISEHIENAGVHSGDAHMVQPPIGVTPATFAKVKEIGSQIAEVFKVSGPFNMQFLEKEGVVKVIECNMRASRSFPFIEKVLDTPFIAEAAKIWAGKPVTEYDCYDEDNKVSHVGVKHPQFSWQRLIGADPVVGVEMASTGEIACLGETIEEAYIKAMMSQTGFKMPKKSIFMSYSELSPANRKDFLEAAKRISAEGFEVFTTNDIAADFAAAGVKVTALKKPSQDAKDNVLSQIAARKIEMVINIPSSNLEERQRLFREKKVSDEYLIRRKAVDFNVPLLTNMQLVNVFSRAVKLRNTVAQNPKSWSDYFPPKTWDTTAQ